MGGAVFHCATRGLMGMKPPTYLMPEENVAAFGDMLDASRDAPLPPLPIQSADYAAWQRATRATSGDAQLRYWTTQLAGAATRERSSCNNASAKRSSTSLASISV